MIAICSLVRNPFNFDTWINYHISIGISKFLLSVEDTPELKEIIDSYDDLIEVEYVSMDSKDKFYDRNYWTLMDRQKTFVTKSIEKCKSLSIDWLLHIDTDELLWCGDSILDLLVGIEPDVDYIHIKNYEAVYSFDNLENPFLQTNTFISSSMMAYKGGKSIGRVSTRLKYLGPHAFHGKYYIIKTKKSVVLHFESATFEHWYKKFSEEKMDISDEMLNKIPFIFYKESISLIREGDLIKCREYYNKMKVCRYNPNTWKLYWTPLLPQKNSHWVR